MCPPSAAPSVSVAWDDRDDGDVGMAVGMEMLQHCHQPIENAGPEGRRSICGRLLVERELVQEPQAEPAL